MSAVDTLPLSSRLDGMAASITGALAARAKELRAQGVPVANFAAGELDLATPEVIVEAAREAALDPRLHHYGPAAGLPELREAVAEHYRPQRRQGEVLVTGGTKQAVYNAIQTLVGPGDEVLLPAPYWVSYPPMIELAGGICTGLSTTTDTGFKVANDALQIHGGYGYLHDYGIEKLVRDLRVHQILEGTNEIMRVIVARAMEIGQ